MTDVFVRERFASIRAIGRTAAPSREPCGTHDRSRKLQANSIAGHRPRAARAIRPACGKRCPPETPARSPPPPRRPDERVAPSRARRGGARSLFTVCRQPIWDPTTAPVGIGSDSTRSRPVARAGTRIEPIGSSGAASMASNNPTAVGCPPSTRPAGDPSTQGLDGGRWPVASSHRKRRPVESATSLAVATPHMPPATFAPSLGGMAIRHDPGTISHEGPAVAGPCKDVSWPMMTKHLWKSMRFDFYF
jgi:hypothetical protein